MRRVFAIAVFMLQVFPLVAMRVQTNELKVSDASTDEQVISFLVDTYFASGANQGVAGVVRALDQLRLTANRELQVLFGLGGIIGHESGAEVIRRRQGQGNAAPIPAANNAQPNQGNDALVQLLVQEVAQARRDAHEINRQLIEQNERANVRHELLVREVLQHNAQMYAQVMQLLNNPRIMQVPQNNPQLVRAQGLLYGLVQQPGIRPNVEPTQAGRFTEAVLDRLAGILNDPIGSAEKLVKVVGVIKTLYELFWPKTKEDAASKKQDEPKATVEQKQNQDNWCSYQNKPFRRERRQLQQQHRRNELDDAGLRRLAELDKQKEETFKRNK